MLFIRSEEVVVVVKYKHSCCVTSISEATAASSNKNIMQPSCVRAAFAFAQTLATATSSSYYFFVSASASQLVLDSTSSLFKFIVA